MNSINENYENLICFDKAKIDELIQLGKDIGEDVLPQLIALHFETSEKILSQMLKQLSSLEYSNLKSLSHKLKSSCGTLGLNKVHKLCDDLENYLSNNKVESFLVRTYVDCIHFEYEQSKVYLWQFRTLKVGA